MKPDNFIYINKKNYYLIDFDFSVTIGSENPRKCSYPYNAPEKNNYTLLYNNASEKSDIWSVGIILLFFYIKKNIYSKYFIDEYSDFSQTNFSSLAEYVLIYGDYVKNYIVKDKHKVLERFIQKYLKNEPKNYIDNITRKKKKKTQ